MLSRTSTRFTNALLSKTPRAAVIAKSPSSTTVGYDEQDAKLLEKAKPYSEMPSPPMWPIIGSAWLFLPIVGRYSVLKSHLANREKRKLYGDIYREKLGPLNVAVSYQAEDMETIYRNEGLYPKRGEFTCIKAYRESRNQWYQSTGLLILEGKEWQDLRKKTQKHLMKAKAIDSYTGTLQDIAGEFVRRIDKIKDSKNEVPNFLLELYKWSVESIPSVALDARLGTLQSDDSDGLRMIKSVQRQFELMNKLEGFLGNIQFWKLFRTPKWKQFEKASDEFSEIAFKYINQSLERMRGLPSEKELTLLQALLAEKGLELPGAMVTVADMLFGGIDTTSHSLGFILYELTKNPDKQEILHEEIKDLLTPSGGALTKELLQDFRYLKACVKEGLRLHPIIPVNARILNKDVALSGYRVPKNTNVIVLMQEICRDERYFKDPNKFFPERWLERQDKGHPFAFLPFGIGVRSCIGRRLAELEIYCAIVEVIKKYKLEYKYEDIDILTKFVNTPDKPLKFTFVERH